jgi:heat-inducible transcriptional repressor
MDERKAAILRAVVEEYIDTAEPVGSGHVARHQGVAVSAATVRNEMAALEHEGYLRQPHTSAGRVPTDRGYRFFVDTLVGPGTLGPSERQQVSAFFATAHGAVEEMLHDASRLLASVTDYPAMVVVPAHEDATIRSAQLVGLGPRVALLVAVLSNGTVEKASVELPAELGETGLSAVSAVLSKSLVGSTLASLPALIPSGDDAIDEIASLCLCALETGHVQESEGVFVGGASRVATSFEATETVRRVLAFLEQQYVVVGLLRDVLDKGASLPSVTAMGLTVAIGSEHGREPLSECSVVVAPYEVDGDPAGTIGILGPTRMHYRQALAAVAVVSSRLSRSLTPS